MGILRVVEISTVPKEGILSEILKRPAVVMALAIGDSGAASSSWFPTRKRIEAQFLHRNISWMKGIFGRRCIVG